MYNVYYTVDREIYAIKIFVGLVAKIKRVVHLVHV